MTLVLMEFLILFPLLAAIVLAFVKGEKVRNVIVCVSAVLIAACSLALVSTNLLVGEQQFALPIGTSEIIEYVCMGISIVVAAVVLVFAVKYHNIAAGVLALVQFAGSFAFDLLFAKGIEVTYPLYLDGLALLMAFIIGVIGSGICVYALGYMNDFQAHEPEGAKDRRPLFFALMFVFLSAMFLIVFSDSMTWMYTGWEVTTLCSFLLIGYTRTSEAIANAFRQIIMNILGGIGFVVALYAVAINMETLSFANFLTIGVYSPALAVIPLVALAFAALTKAAQMPFHTWLLGAMVAPTPTSALLHSSTMVKAGVFLLIRLAPLFAVCSVPSIMVVLVGIATFCLCSFMAISQSNAKRVLAYSTIANLGLIVACAGVGTPEAVWAGMFLILFHAAAKSLLFICVGTAEHHIGSRDIEDMDLLFERMPKLARFMMLGIMSMFIAPFGMLISKWAALVSFIDAGQIALLVLLAFGSAATFMFWAKWFGKLAGIASNAENVELTVHKTEWVSIVLMAVVSICACVCLPLISTYLVQPYIYEAFGVFGTYGNLYAALSADVISADNLWITSIISAVMFVVLFAAVGKGSSKSRKVDVYLAGATVDAEGRVFKSALSKPLPATQRNMYLPNLFGEESLSPIGSVFCIVIIALAIAGSCLRFFGIL